MYEEESSSTRFVDWDPSVSAKPSSKAGSAECCDEESCVEGLELCGPCSTTKPFCCTLTVNEAFLPATLKFARLVWKVSKLAALVEECASVMVPVPGCPRVNVPLFQVRLKGCIPFIASAEYKFTGPSGKTCGGVFDPYTCQANPNHQDRTYNVCCPGSASVDQVIKVFACKDDAQKLADQINGSVADNPGISCPGASGATVTVSATLCVRERDCGKDQASCPPSGNQNVTFCGVFKFNFPDC